MIRLTKTTVDNLAAPHSGQAFLWDSEVRNFGVRVTAGGVKTFVIRYRNADGRSRRLSIGRYGILTLEQARIEARRKLAEVALGGDPAEDRAERKRAPSVADVCDWYLEEAEAGRLLGRRNRPIKASTLYMDRSRIERHIKPLLGSRKVASLKTSEIARFQSDIAEGKTQQARRSGRGRGSAGGPGAAARTVTTLHAIFGHAVRFDLITGNPASGVRRIASNVRERRLSSVELSRFGQAMRDLEAVGEDKKGLDVVRLLALTGFRLNEAQGLCQSWVDIPHRFVMFPDTKSDGQKRAIGRVAAALIDAQPQNAVTDFVFPADLSALHYKQAPDVILRIVTQARLDAVTAHTLRHTFGSIAGELGFSELTIQGMLGHGKRGVTQGYIHIDEGLRLAIEATSKTIARLLDGEQRSVAPFANFKEACDFIDQH